ncbi:uncharacterized protein SCHCODRAFT_02603945, partial [Schizophyllum commune H4-8]
MGTHRAAFPAPSIALDQRDPTRIEHAHHPPFRSPLTLSCALPSPSGALSASEISHSCSCAFYFPPFPPPYLLSRICMHF